MPKKTFDLASEEKILLVQLKDNQKHLLQDVQTLAENSKPSNRYTAEAQYGHGRIANRTTEVYYKGIDDYIIDQHWAAHLKTLVCVRRAYDVFNTKTKCYEQRNETAWYVCNTKLTAEQAAGFIN